MVACQKTIRLTLRVSNYISMVMTTDTEARHDGKGESADAALQALPPRVDSAQAGGVLVPEVQKPEVGRAHQGESIPAGHDYYREYVDRAEGRGVIGRPYWD